MKLMIGLFATLITLGLLTLMNMYVLKFVISDFAVGWLSCMAYYISTQAYDEYKMDN